ncbi:hypothetical protein FN976_20600 [Caenimonas sedimenti]|uniref:Replication-associated protein G2P N-terminal domain-containing protein n=1 Tax=Caenimonas sedimenti TaxID=2596921 RepID=A0A562ZLA5_9BURK|nr:phage/plasmid replication protein [Caenimonas sedimenti]TWO69136.1 hypothetical protein FN976_20600 [Caenimonas sedimenti]
MGAIFNREDPNYGKYTTASEAVGTKAKRKYDDPAYFYARSLVVPDRDHAYELLADCCPPKQLQDHNFFGHGDIRSYAHNILELAAQRYDRRPTPEEVADWARGYVKLQEMHLCANFSWDPSQKLPAINAIDANNPTGKHRDWETCLTLGFGPKGRSQNHTCTIYCKYELLLKDMPKPGPLQQRLLDLARRSLRIEIKLYSQWFRTHGVDEAGRVWLAKTYKGEKPLKSLLYVMNWESVDLDALYFELLKTYNIANSIQRQLTDDEVEGLSNGARRAYRLWLGGNDLAAEYCRASVHKHAKEVKLKFGVDISAARRPEKLPALDLGDLLVPANIVPIPEWAYGTARYWPPGKSLVRAEDVAISGL